VVVVPSRTHEISKKGRKKPHWGEQPEKESIRRVGKILRLPRLIQKTSGRRESGCEDAMHESRVRLRKHLH